jgi:tetratricopeptide (TPR) repeat protein
MTTFTAPGTVMALTLCTVLSSAHLRGESTDAVAAATHKAIHQFEARVAETPRDYLSYTILGQLQGRLARETGNLDAYRRAETAIRAALRVNGSHLPAMLGLAATLASQHQFAEAIALARLARQTAPESVDALAVLGDAALEVGDYEQARSAFTELAIRVPPGEPSAVARQAQLLELHGKVPRALDLLRQAAATEMAEDGPGEAAAWYQTRIGGLHYRQGRLEDAADAFSTALRLLGGYYIALDGLADVRAAQGRDTEAIELLEQAVSHAPQPGSLVALGDLYTRRSRLEAAERVYRQAEAIAKYPGNEAAYRRELAVFYADHGRNLPQALSLAQQDLASRPDIHGYDTLAWTLYKSGRFEEAAAAMTRAMALGTVDGVLYVHAALIEDRNGRTAKAREHLNAAMALTPYLLNDEARQLDVRLSMAVDSGKR